MPAPTKLVDSHQHVRWHQRDEHGLIADMDAHGIDYAWLLTWQLSHTDQAPEYNYCLNPELFLPDGSHPGIPLSELLETKVQYPKRFVVGFCPHPTWEQAPRILESAYNMHGVRVCGEWKFRVPFDDPRCLAIFQKAGELKMPVVLHLDVPTLPDPETGEPVFQPLWYGGTVANLENALKACPDTIFIGHAPGFGARSAVMLTPRRRLILIVRSRPMVDFIGCSILTPISTPICPLGPAIRHYPAIQNTP